MTKVFLCYRSEDDGYAAALLDDKLSAVIGQRNVFRASRSIEPGENYEDVIMTALGACHSVIVIIGPTWQEHIQKSVNNELFPQEDWVRTEIATALKLKKQVIPLLLSRTPRLSARELPEDISGLGNNQYLKFELQTLEKDLARLVAKLKPPVSLTNTGLATASDDHAEYEVRRETGWDGSVELDVLRRSANGAIMGRVTGRAHPLDLSRMAALLSQSAAVEPDTNGVIAGDPDDEEPSRVHAF